MTARADIIVRRLQTEMPRGPWRLGARNRDTGRIYEQAEFAPSEARAVRRWIEKQHRKGLFIVAGMPAPEIRSGGHMTLSGFIGELRRHFPEGPWQVGLMDRHGVLLAAREFEAGDEAGVLAFAAEWGSRAAGYLMPIDRISETVAIIKKAWPKPPFDVIATKPDGTLAAQKVCADEGELRRFINLHALELGNSIGARLP